MNEASRIMNNVPSAFLTQLSVAYLKLQGRTLNLDMLMYSIDVNIGELPNANSTVSGREIGTFVDCKTPSFAVQDL